MTTKSIAVEAMEIIGAPGLDPIHVFWQNVDHSKGYVTIICYGSAWTAYFGGMGNIIPHGCICRSDGLMGMKCESDSHARPRTIQEFFASVDVSYMVSAMGVNQTLKQGKGYYSHLAKIIKAVKEALAAS